LQRKAIAWIGQAKPLVRAVGGRDCAGPGGNACGRSLVSGFRIGDDRTLPGSDE